MEEIVCQFQRWVRVYVYDTKTDCTIIDIIRTYLHNEAKAIHLLRKLSTYPEWCVFLICPNKASPKFNKQQVLSDTSSDLCLIHQGSLLYINDYSEFNMTVLDNTACLVIYQQGLEKATLNKTSKFNMYFYLVPVLGLLLLLYFIERAMFRKSPSKRLGSS